MPERGGDDLTGRADFIASRPGSIPPRSEETFGLTFDRIEARDRTAGADDVRLDCGPIGKVGGGFDSITDSVRRGEAKFDRSKEGRECVRGAGWRRGVKSG